MENRQTQPPPLELALARLERLVDWERRARAAMRVSTEPERRLLELLGDPHRGLRVVHVTGSKGKGSTAALIAAGLESAGLRAGRYASPHVERIHERVVIDGAEVADEPLAEGLRRALDARDELVRRSPEVEPTWFDVVTAAALWIFARAGVEWLVAEVGLGGRLDSTNVLDGEVCVITNVELEHTSVLGSTRAAIAREKAGILKPGCTLVTGVAEDDEAGRVIASAAAALGVRVLRPVWPVGERIRIVDRNRALAALALDELGRRGVRTAAGERLGEQLLDAAAIERARLPGRMERFEVGGTTVLLDGAHTPVSVSEVLADLSADATLPGKPMAILGTAREKDLAGILKALVPQVEKVFGTSVGTELHRTSDEIASAARELGGVVHAATPPRAALELALADARRARSWVLVIGSLYLAGSLRSHLRQAAR